MIDGDLGPQPDIGGTAELFRLAFEHAPIGIVLAAPDGDLLWVNHAVCEMLGYESHELNGRSYADIIHPDDLDRDADHLERMIREGTTAYTVERRSIRGDGSVVAVQLDVSVLRGTDGLPRAFVAHVQDISARRSTLAALASAHEALQVSQQRFAALVERSTDIICIIDEAGAITYHSPAAEKMLGFASDSWIGRPFSQVVHRDDLPGLMSLFEELIAEPSASGSAEVRLITAEGAWRNVEILATNRLSDPAVRGIVANVRDVTERAEAATRLTWQAFHDSLTRLPNRALLNDRLGHALNRAQRSGERTAVMFMDLDRFKVVNDSMGHEAGDALLVEVARRLAATVRSSDTVARLGGDEFVVLVETVSDTDEVLALARRLSAAVAEPIEIGKGVVNTSVSIGIAFDDDGRSADQLLRDADTALYRAKEKGRNRFHVFTESLRVAAMRRVDVEHRLRRALEHDRLVLHHQPILDLMTGDVVAVEALLRVDDGVGGLELPREYLDVADEAGLMPAVGERVLTAALGALTGWRARLGARGPARIAINVSARELAHGDFADLVAELLKTHDLPPSVLDLEFTESTVIGADRTTLRTVNRLHEMGVGLSIDDFGTGYSSLAYLKRFPIRSVKLDRAFVAGLGSDRSDAEIVRAVVSLGEALHLDVIAEGIETTAQLETLQELGCSYGQGFLLGHPGEADALDLSSGPSVIGDTSTAWAVAPAPR